MTTKRANRAPSSIGVRAIMKGCLVLALISGVFVYSALWSKSSAQTASLLPNGKQTFLDSNGKPLTGGKVTFYVPGTTTLKTTWQDAGQTISNTNPVTLDAAGRAVIYGNGDYQQVVRDKNDNVIWNAQTSSTGTGGGGGGGSATVGDGQPVGSIQIWAGLIAPAAYAFAYGQEFVRSSFPELFQALTINQNVSCTSGSATLTGISDTQQLPVGAKIESTCLNPGSTVLSTTTSTVVASSTAIISTTTTARFFPYGNGDGNLTFNGPDLRGRTLAGRDNMGSIAANRMTTAYFGNNPDALGASGGNESKTLIVGNLPPYTPTGNVSVVNGAITSTPNFTHLSAANTGGSFLALSNATGTVDFAISNSQATSSATFAGTAQGGTSVPISSIQPTITTNYIIKTLPDTNPNSYFGVASLGGMTGVIVCGQGVNCSGNTITATTSSVSPPSSATLGGVFQFNAIANKFVTGVDGTGTFTSAQPSFSNLLGQIVGAQIANNTITNGMLANSSTTVNGTTCTLGSSCSPASSGTITINSTACALNGSCTIPTGTTPSIANTQVLANTSGSTAAAIGTSATTWFDSAYCATAGYLLTRITGTWQCSNAIPANVVWLGADVSGAAASDTAFNTACAQARTVYVPPGTYKISTNTTYSTCKYWNIDQSASINPDTGITLTFRGITNDTYTRKFAGAGSVVGFKSARPEWWGAIRNGTTDDAGAINGAITSIANSASSDGDGYKLKLSCGSYFFASTLSFTVTQSILWDVEGCGSINASGAGGTFLIASATFTGSIAMNFSAAGDVFSNYSIKNFILTAKTHNAGPSVGLQIGSTGGNLQGLSQSVIENTVVQGFSNNYLLNNVRLLALNRTSSWSSDSAGVETTGTVGYTLQTSAGATSFVGDIDFWGGQAVGPMSGGLSGNNISLNVANGIGIGGVRFHGFVNYGSSQQVLMQASGGATIFDVWFIGGCQFEGPPAATGNAIAGTAASPSSIGDIHVDHAYFSGSGYVNPIKFPAPGLYSSSGSYQHFFITNNFFANTNGAGTPVDIRGTGGSASAIHVNGNEFRGIASSSTAAAYLENTSHSMANNNSVVTPSSTITYAIYFNGGSGNYISAVGNNCGGYCSTGQAINNGSAVANYLGGNTLNLQ
jgi:hypothetical protein